MNQPATYLNLSGVTLPLPVTSVVDLALVEDRGWALLEFNATWGAGLNGCSAVAAARCIGQATTLA